MWVRIFILWKTYIIQRFRKNTKDILVCVKMKIMMKIPGMSSGTLGIESSNFGICWGFIIISRARWNKKSKRGKIERRNLQCALAKEIESISMKECLHNRAVENYWLQEAKLGKGFRIDEGRPTKSGPKMFSSNWYAWESAILDW